MGELNGAESSPALYWRVSCWLVLLFSLSLRSSAAAAALNPQRKEQPNQHSLFICRLGQPSPQQTPFQSFHPFSKNGMKWNEVLLLGGCLIQLHSINFTSFLPSMNWNWIEFVELTYFYNTFCFSLGLVSSNNTNKKEMISFFLKKKVICLGSRPTNPTNQWINKRNKELLMKWEQREDGRLACLFFNKE